MSRKQAALAVAAVLTYVLLWLGFARSWAWNTALDDLAVRTFHDFGATRPRWISFWTGISTVFGPAVLRVIALVGTIWCAVHRQFRTASFLAVCVIGAGLVTETAKTLSARPRPDTALAAASSTSFPSGHALGATVAALVLLTLLWPQIVDWARVPAVVAATAIVVCVSVSRVALNVHHPTDVVAGWALGYLWFLLCLRVLPPRIPQPAHVSSQQASRRSAC